MRLWVVVAGLAGCGGGAPPAVFPATPPPSVNAPDDADPADLALAALQAQVAPTRSLRDDARATLRHPDAPASAALDALQTRCTTLVHAVEQHGAVADPAVFLLRSELDTQLAEVDSICAAWRDGRRPAPAPVGMGH